MTTSIKKLPGLKALATTLATGLAVSLAGTAMAQTAPAPAPTEVDALVREAMLYAYPYNEFMQMRHTALNDRQSPTFTRLNAFKHARHLATPNDRWANGPIRDAFYSTAWTDLGQTPVLLTLPETHGRYYVIAFVGADLNTFTYVGRRLTGTSARKVVIVAPDWNGPIPKADQIVRAPTRDVYFNLRVLVDGPEDLKQAHAVQDGFSLKPHQPKAPALEPQQVPMRGDWGRFVDVANESLTRNPPPASENALLQKLKAVGICGSECRWNALPPHIQERWMALAPGIETELKGSLNADRAKQLAKNGWVPYRLPKSFGNNYRLRAGSAAMSGGILGVEAAEATYFSASLDHTGEALGGGQRYKLHLPKGRLPADAFWSVSLYEFVTGGQYMVDNPIDRYSIGDRTRGLKYNADGSLDLWIQPEDPGPEKRANWLPSPKSNLFYLMARAYQPWPEVLDPLWVMPAVERLP